MTPDYADSFLGLYHGASREVYTYVLRTIERHFAQQLPPGSSFAAALASLPTATLLPLINSWTDAMRVEERSPAYFRLRVSVAKSFCKYLVSLGVREGNPLDFVRCPPIDTVRQHAPAYSMEEERRFFSTIAEVKDAKVRHRDLSIFGFMARNGLRRNEVRLLRFDQIIGDFVGAKPLGKGGKTRLVSIAPRVAEDLRMYLELDGRKDRSGTYVFLATEGPPKPLSNSRLTQLGHLYAKRAGLAKGACHIHRRSFATIANEQGVPFEQLRIALGHSDPAMTARYIKCTTSKVNADF